MLDTVELFGGSLGQEADDFGVSALREVGSRAPVTQELRKAAGMIGVLVRNEDGVNVAGGMIKRGEATKSFFAAKTCVDQETSALGFKQCGIA